MFGSSTSWSHSHGGMRCGRPLCVCSFGSPFDLLSLSSRLSTCALASDGRQLEVPTGNNSGRQTSLPPEDQDLCYSLAGRAGSDVIRDGDGNHRRRNAAHVECDRAVVPLKGITLAGLYAAEYLFKVNRPARSAGLKQRRTGLRDLNRLNEFGDHSQGLFLRIAIDDASKQLRNGCIDERYVAFHNDSLGKRNAEALRSEE